MSNGDSLPRGAGEIVVNKVGGTLSVTLTVKESVKCQLVTLSLSHYCCGLVRLWPGAALRWWGQIWVFALSLVKIGA